VAPKGMLTDRELKAGVLGLEQLVGRPFVGLDARDPLGITLGQLMRDSELNLQIVITVQTYHAALAMAQYGVGMALIESCSASAADPGRVDVLPVSPKIPTAINVLRPIANPKARIANAFSACFQQALDELALV
jgi:DNA-binding transcriptional LysR family regulator